MCKVGQYVVDEPIDRSPDRAIRLDSAASGRRWKLVVASWASKQLRAAYALGVYQLASSLKPRYILQFTYSHTKSRILLDNLTFILSYHPNPY